jgi:hypothetical protein
MIKRIYYKMINNITDRVEQSFKRELLIDSYKSSALINDSSIIISNEDVNPQIIISLTSFSTRVKSVFLTLESIARQTKKPNKVILWLAEDEFNNNSLPLTLNHFKKRGLDIMYCKDIKSYKKLIPTMKLFPNDIIITIDDDVIYDIEMIEELYNAHKKYPNAICCHRSHVITKNKKGEIQPYNNWGDQRIITEPSIYQFPPGVGGVLYFPNCFDDEIFDEEKFMEVAPTNDDFWFKALALKNNILTYNPNVYNKDRLSCIALESSKISHLAEYNVIQGGNDQYMQNILKRFNLSL